MPVQKGYVHESLFKAHVGKESGLTPLGDRLKQERRRLGFKIDELANLAGIHRTQILAIENRGAIPRFNTMVKIAQALDCSLDWLAGLED